MKRFGSGVGQKGWINHIDFLSKSGAGSACQKQQTKNKYRMSHRNRLLVIFGEWLHVRIELGEKQRNPECPT
jgi:hypothetical protein